MQFKRGENPISQKNLIHRFSFNHIPWNKNKKIQTNTGKTHFKKGQKAWSRGKKLSQIIREKMSKAKLGKIGKYANNWKGGKTPRNKHYLSHPKYKKWRQDVFKRDNYQCVKCGDAGFIQADHIKRWANYPKLRFNINNGQTLCVPCHRKKTRNEWKNH